MAVGGGKYTKGVVAYMYTHVKGCFANNKRKETRMVVYEFLNRKNGLMIYFNNLKTIESKNIACFAYAAVFIIKTCVMQLSFCKAYVRVFSKRCGILKY